MHVRATEYLNKVPLHYIMINYIDNLSHCNTTASDCATLVSSVYINTFTVNYTIEKISYLYYISMHG